MQRPFFSLLVALTSLLLPALHAHADDSAAVKKVSQTFFKEYLASKDPWAYLAKSPLLTPAAKHSFLTIKKKADKDGGLDSDPVTKSQDHPKSYQIVSIGLQSDKATAVAEAKGFTSIYMRFVKQPDAWKIDSVGEINSGATH